MRSKTLRCKYALKIACRITKQVLGNSPSSACLAENVRPQQQNGLFFSTKSNFERSIVNHIDAVHDVEPLALTPTPESESVRFW